MGLFLLLRNSEASIITNSERHLTALAQTLALDYVNHARYDLAQRQQPALTIPIDPGSNQILSLMTTVALRHEIGIEGGFYSRNNNGLLGYAFPTHEGPGVKKDIPVAETPTIVDLARKAIETHQAQTQRFSGARDVVVFAAAPIFVNKTAVGSTWMMQRMPGVNSGRSLKVLLGTVAFAVAAFACAFFAFLISARLQAGVGAVIGRLGDLRHDLSHPRSAQEQLTEFENILSGIDVLSTTLSEKILRERELENKLRHQERLSALGQFAAGIAHELRNPLATMRLRTQMIERLSSDPAIHKSLNVVSEEIVRLDAMIERLLYFSRPIKLNLQRANLVEFCAVIVEFWSIRTSEAGIAMSFDLKEQLVECDIDRVRFRQVLDNLIANAVEAIHAQPSPPGAITVRVVAEGQFALIEVEDNGPGLNKEEQANALNPFFTTKASGTGLGLSIAYEIVKAHEGDLWLENRAEGGARAVVRFPFASGLHIEVPQ